MKMETLKMGVLISLLTLLTGCSSASSMNTQESITGQWTIEPVAAAGNEVKLVLQRRVPENTSTTTFNIPLEKLIGLTSGQVAANSSSVRFELVREAGTFTCEGKFNAGRGSGTFVFSANPNFSKNLNALGYKNLSNERIFEMALYDITTGFIRDLKSLGYDNPPVEQLIPMKVHNVSIEFIRELKVLGYARISLEQLIPMRIHGVSIDYLRGLKELGYENVPAEQLIPMRIHGVSIEYIKELKALGYNRVPVEQLIPMNIHKVTPDFIRKAKARAQSAPPVEELIRLRISGNLN